ncbi:MAG: hypothetical protein II320_01925, partial [Oscillospiraceae bacterium]|nr:hypothetical protein [Oscillospiraceae bacterium]
GTNYDRGLEYMYRLGYAAQQHNIDNGLDRQVVGIFMSDGAPMQYNYFSGRTITSAWTDWFTGAIDPDKFQSAAFDEDDKPQKLELLEQVLLEVLKTRQHSLANPDALFYRSADAETRLVSAGIVKEDGTAKYDKNTAVRGWPKDGSKQLSWAKMANGAEAYFLLENTSLQECTSIYSVMARNGILLDEKGFQRLADVNGVSIDVANATQEEIRVADQALLAIAKSQQPGALTLRYPTTTLSTRYLYDPDATDLYTSLEALMGREVTWIDLVQIAYRSADRVGDDQSKDSLGYVEVGGVQYDLQTMLKEIYAEVTVVNEGYEWATLSPYHYFYNEDGKNWWAEAIKGDTDKLYPVINKYAHDEVYEGYNGTVRNYYDDGSDAAWAGQDYIGGFRGLGIPIYTLGMSIGDTVLLTHEDTQMVLDNISSGESYAFAAYSGDDLNAIFASIASSVTSSATRAYFVDTLGEDYDLQTTVIKNVEPAIEVRNYVLDKEHQRTGEYQVLERVTFGGSGVATSSAVSKAVVTTDPETEEEITVVVRPDIWLDNGLIDGKHFYYNTNTAGTDRDLNHNGITSLEDGDVVDGEIRLDLSGDGKLDYTLAPETFFWILGAIGSDQLVLDYPVVLTGSDSEDPAVIPEPGKYPTNESAKLYYVNYIGNDEVKDTVSPQFSWGDSMSVDKKAEKQEENYLLTLEAFTNGQTTQFNKTEPADIVLVLDQSASMYTPAGHSADVLKADEAHSVQLPSAAQVPDFVSRVQSGDTELLEEAKRPGYYMAVHDNGNYIYIVQYLCYDLGADRRDPADDKWGWFYVPVKDTATPVTFDTQNTYEDTDEALAVGGTYAQGNKGLLTNVTYYKTQYAALYDSVTAFVTDLNVQAMKTGVKHRVAIVGFASPYYDAYDYYQGTGVYIDGKYYLYDDEYMYKGREDGGTLVRDDANGTVILDPDRGYANGTWPLAPYAADASEYAYEGIGDKYSSAFVDISTEAGFQSVMASVDAIRTNYLQTCPAIGLRIARSIFRGEEIPLVDPGVASTNAANYQSAAEALIQKADPTGRCPEGKDQVIILFTDGVPTVSMYADHEDSNSLTKNAEVFNEYWTGNAGVRDAINEANAAKREGVKIYTIGTAAASKQYGNQGQAGSVPADDRVEFLKLVSSDHPGASSVYDVVTRQGNNEVAVAWNLYVDYGTAATALDRSYAQSATEQNALTIAFTSAMQSITAPTVELDEFDILRDVLSDYFEFIGKNADEIKAGIKVYTADFKADGFAVGQDQWKPLSTAQVKVSKTDPTVARYDIIEVTGYDYSEMYFSTTPRQVGGKDYYGSKLIVQIPVQVTSGFTGGVDVPTNEDTSGIYDVEEGGETIVIPFPIPKVDIDSGMVTNKTAEPKPGTDNEFLLTLEAYATGSLRELVSTKPADIVLVLDHSASMRTPVGATEILYNANYGGYLYGQKGKTDKGQLTHSQLDIELGKHKGYYVCQSTNTPYAWFIMEFSESLNQWKLYNVPSTQSLVDSSDGSEYTQILEVSHEVLGRDYPQLVFYKSQYAMLYDSVLSFVTELRDSKVAHNVSIVGFAGSETQGSRLYVGGDETLHKNYSSALYNPGTSGERRTELYQKAMKNVVMETEFSELLSLVEAIDTNFSFTCPAVGLKMANEIFEANPVDPEARDRIVILFTDGLPNVMIGEDAIDQSNTDRMIFDEIIAQAYTSKSTHGAQVYSISTSTTGAEANRGFLHYLSSDYPDARSFDDHGDPIEGAPVFTKEVSAADDLDEAFGNVTEHFSSTTVKLDGNTLLVEILSEYFNLLNNGGKAADGSHMDVRVFKQLYQPDTIAKWGEKIPLGDHAIIELSSSDGTDRMDTVTVAGFDYAKEYISEIPRADDDGNSYYGSKLVLEVDVITREGFWGGEGVPTNDVKTGLYPPDSDVPAEIFPVPEVDLWPDVYVEDIIVLDYGMDVEIDMVKAHPLLHGESQILGFVDHIPAQKLATTLLDHRASEDGTFGDAVLQSAQGSKLRYELAHSTAMQMDGHDTFHYVGQYTADKKTSYYYGTIKVVPATVMYFEEHFLDFTLDTDMMAVQGWVPAGNGNDAPDTFQDQDRPGEKHPYGHDSHYVTYDRYSMDGAQMINVMQGKNGAATFRFKGTGFDVISKSSRDTGTVLVNVFRLDEDGKRIDEYDSTKEFPAEPDTVVNAFKTSIVDTYYGYSYQQNEDTGDYEWVPDGGTGDNALYQVPVIKMEDLPYGLYEVEVYVAYTDIFAPNGRYPDQNYDFYVDAIRIYDPANDGVDDEVIGGAYEDDGERWPVYEELRDMLLPTDKATEIGALTKEISALNIRLKGYDDILTQLKILGRKLEKEDDAGEQQKLRDKIAALETGKAQLEAQSSAQIALRTQKQAELDAMISGRFQNAIFIDGKDGQMSVSDYLHYGPNNELYLAAGQSVYFQIDESDPNMERVQLAMKTLGGVADVTITSNGEALDPMKIATSTDLYYDFTGLGDVTITNESSSGDVILSITNVKTTYKADPYATGSSSLESGPFTVDADGLMAALMMLSGDEAPEVEPSADPQLSLKAPSLSFEDEVFYNVYFTVGDMTDVVEMGLMLLPSLMADGTVEDAIGIIPGYQTNGAMYMVRTDGIPAAQMGDTVYFKVYAKLADGTYAYSTAGGYNAKAYAKTVLGGDYAESMKALVVAMLSYGAEAQKFFGHNTGSLMDAGLTAEQKTLISGY